MSDLDCPFCGGTVDPNGWLNSEGERGPECETCGATAPSLKRWNARVTVVDTCCDGPRTLGAGWHAPYCQNSALNRDSTR